MGDLKFALRFLRKRWLFSSVAVVIMALGISLTATVFAIIEGAILRGPDYDDFERIAYLETTIPQSQFFQNVRIHDYRDWTDRQTVFDEMAAWYHVPVIVSGDGDRAERFEGVRLTSSTFSLLGVEPFMGRTVSLDEDFVPDTDVVVLSYHVWANRYDRDPQIVGKTLRLNARPTTVIGVMPEDFAFPESQDMWLPIPVDPATLERGGGPGLQVIGTMSEGVTLEAAQAQMSTVARQLSQEFPVANRDILPVLEIWRDAQFTDAETKGILYTMFAAVIGVLLIACANVANLLFALTAARGKELAVRTAMGAARTRVIRQLLIESLMLAAIGALLGVALTEASLAAFRRAVVTLGPPTWMTFETSGLVLVFVVVISVVAAFAAGFVPALHATRSDVAGILRDQGRGGSSRSVNRWSSGLVTLEVAVSCALLVAAGLTIRSTLAVGANNFGVNTSGILTASITLPGESYPDSVARLLAVDRIQRDLAALPGVEHAVVSSALPGVGTGNYWYGIRDREYANDADYSFAGMTTITPDFFAALDVVPLSGRIFSTQDSRDAERVVIVDQRFAERNWPGEDPIGRQVRTGRSDSEQPWMTVVGVVPVIEMSQADDFGGAPPEGMFVPASQRPLGGFNVMLRATGQDPLALAAPLRDAVSRIDGDIPVELIDALDGRLRDVNMQYVIIGWMFSIFGIVALGLASVGLYAVMAFSVSRRQTEVGVRMAMGAEPGTILRLILVQGSKPLFVGIVIGLGLAVGLGRALSTILFGVTGTDPATFATIPLLLVLVSVVALLIPASRASRIAPVVALRDDM